ncbi:MAG TPA: hypothetical protein VFY13_00515, partial [Luteolibacter sp.]|nr:hypothetical protein [Luteolibacter sp.]
MKICGILLGLVLWAAAGASAAESSLSLAGDWSFGLQGDKAFTEKIRLPGTMSDAGLGPRNTAPVDLLGPYHHHVYEGPAWYEREIEIPEAWA